MEQDALSKDRKYSRSQIMTPKEAAKYLGLHLITIYRLTASLLSHFFRRTKLTTVMDS